MENHILMTYLKGKLDDNSSKKVEEWISLSEENRKIVEDIYVVLFVDERLRAKKEIDVKEALNEFRRKNKINLKKNKESKTIRLWRNIAKIAAIIIVCLLSGSLLTLALLEKNANSITVSTNLGEQIQILLPDGSKAWLNACSRLNYQKSFLSLKRKVKLTGEAYFEVAHNATFPFVVSTHNSEIRALGTKFNVRNNEDDACLTASLIEGSIRFTNENSHLKVLLKPGEEMIFNKKTNQYHLNSFPIKKDNNLIWIDKSLSFEGASLEEIAKSLEKYHNVNIVFADENLKKERFNADFQKGDNIYLILSLLELTNKITYEIHHNRTIILSSKKTYNTIINH